MGLISAIDNDKGDRKYTSATVFQMLMFYEAYGRQYAKCLELRAHGEFGSAQFSNCFQNNPEEAAISRIKLANSSARFSERLASSKDFGIHSNKKRIASVRRSKFQECLVGSPN